MWSLRHRDAHWVLKVVKAERQMSNMATEAEMFMRMAREYPALTSDRHVAFPLKIFECYDESRVHRYDLIAMRYVHGRRLDVLIGSLWYSDKKMEVMELLRRAGSVIRDFQGRYAGAQHSDFTPSNVLVDQDEDRFTLIDLGGMGSITEDDVSHFKRALDLMSKNYGTWFRTTGTQYFERGYCAKPC
jgi:tRNA A-37 threonylcarbamoyl transferase component Bud32